MKRPLAYLTAAWSGEPDVDMELFASSLSGFQFAERLFFLWGG